MVIRGRNILLRSIILTIKCDLYFMLSKPTPNCFTISSLGKFIVQIWSTFFFGILKIIIQKLHKNKGQSLSKLFTLVFHYHTFVICKHVDPSFHGSMQNHAGRKTCAGRQEKYALDRARWGLFSVSPPKPATHVKKKSVMVGP